MLGDFMFAIMLLRFYLLFRTLLNLNLFAELTSKRICGGNGMSWTSSTTGNNGPASSAAIRFPFQLTFDTVGNMYFTEDFSNAPAQAQIQKINTNECDKLNSL